MNVYMNELILLYDYTLCINLYKVFNDHSKDYS